MPAQAVWNAADSVVSSRLIYPEARAALAAARRAGRLTARLFPRALSELEGHFADLSLVELNEHVARAAGEVAERYRLRASDAIHLASALTIPAQLTVSTWDTELRRASLEAGLSVAP